MVSVAEAIERLCQCAGDLPLEPGRPNGDPSAVCCFVDMATIIIEAALPTPAIEGDGDIERELADARAQLWRALIQLPSETLSAQYVSAAPTGSTHGVCLGELGALAALRMVWLLARHQPALATHTVTAIQWTGDTSRPVLASSMGEIADALQTTRTAFIEQPYSDELVGLVELLEMAAARLLFESGTRGLFDLDDTLCRPVPRADGEWIATPAFLQMVWPTLLGFQRFLGEARCLMPKNIDQPLRHPEAAARLRQWLRCRADEVVYSDASPTLKRLLMRCHLRPGDRELYRLQHPMTTASDLAIVAASMGNTRMADINGRMHLSPSACIRRDLYEAVETTELGLCIYDLLDMLTRGSPGCEWALHYARIDVDMAVDAVEHVQRCSDVCPFVVRLFNGWQLVYAGAVHWFNSSIDAIVAWLRVLAADGAASALPTVRAAAASSFYRELMADVFESGPRRAPPAATGALAFSI